MVSLQAFKLEITVIVPEMPLPVRFSGTVHGLIFPIPEAPRPMPVPELFQRMDAPTGVLLKAGTFTRVPGQTAKSLISFRIGLGFMLMKKEVVSLHPSRLEVTEISPLISAPVAFSGAVQLPVGPFPPAGSPMAVLVFVQLKELPAGVLLNG